MCWNVILSFSENSIISIYPSISVIPVVNLEVLNTATPERGFLVSSSKT